MSPLQPFHRLALATALFFSLAPSSWAAGDPPTVTAVLSHSRAIVGQVVEMQIRVKGSGATVPETISVEGLQIQANGTSQNFNVENFTISQSVTYSFAILPLKAGTFRIPPQNIVVRGHSFQTPALELTVVDGGQPNRSSPDGESRNASLPANISQPWAEIILSRNSAYVGQAVEAEIDVAFDPRVLLDSQALIVGPELKALGITFHKWERPEEKIRNIKGVRQRCFVYKTAIVPVKAGHFEIPAEIEVGMRAPVVRRFQSRSDGRSDPLEEMMEQMERMMPQADYGPPTVAQIKSPPVILEVKPLPTGAPSTFDGAVGNFSLAADANPKQAQVGDPITVTATVSGRGNFDRVTAPTLADTKGWHSYPPSSKFKQDDDVGISGSKTFDIILSPNERKDSIPSIEFTYFDPVLEKYVTKKSDAIPIHVEGEALPAASATPSAAASAPAPSTTPSVAPQSTTKLGEILAHLDDRRQSPASFNPVFLKKEFWLAQLLALAGLVGYLIWRIWGARRRNLDSVRHGHTSTRSRGAPPKTSPERLAASRLLRGCLARHPDKKRAFIRQQSGTYRCGCRDQGSWRR